MIYKYSMEYNNSYSLVFTHSVYYTTYTRRSEKYILQKYSFKYVKMLYYQFVIHTFFFFKYLNYRRLKKNTFVKPRLVLNNYMYKIPNMHFL
jgi:hypothetical protein